MWTNRWTLWRLLRRRLSPNRKACRQREKRESLHPKTISFPLPDGKPVTVDYRRSAIFLQHASAAPESRIHPLLIELGLLIRRQNGIELRHRFGMNRPNLRIQLRILAGDLIDLGFVIALDRRLQRLVLALQLRRENLALAARIREDRLGLAHLIWR